MPNAERAASSDESTGRLTRLRHSNFASRTIQDVIVRIRAEYLEMPDMQLTGQQVERFFGMERAVCEAVLDSLVDTQFLSVRPDGAYALLTDARVRRAGQQLPT
jgi:hypothetical protein